MTQNLKQHNVLNILSDAGLNKAGLFARASSGDILAKLVRGDDFYNRFAH